jgi:hypothetical protein
MKAFVITVIGIALYLLLCLVFPKPKGTKKGDAVPQKRETDTDDVIIPSRYVSGLQRQPQPTPSTSVKPENQTEKGNTFASESGKTSAVIPPEVLDEVFSRPPEPMAIDYPLDRVEDEPKDEATGEPDADEEAEELRQSLGRDAALADGFTYEQMAQAIETVDSPEEGKAQAAGEVLYSLEKTDLFEQLVSSDEAKAARIKSAIDRHVQSILPEETDEDSNNEYNNFDIADFLG